MSKMDAQVLNRLKIDLISRVISENDESVLRRVADLLGVREPLPDHQEVMARGLKPFKLKGVDEAKGEDGFGMCAVDGTCS